MQLGNPPLCVEASLRIRGSSLGEVTQGPPRDDHRRQAAEQAQQELQDIPCSNTLIEDSNYIGIAIRIGYLGSGSPKGGHLEGDI